MICFAAGLADNPHALFNRVYEALRTRFVRDASPGEGYQLFLESLWCERRNMSTIQGRNPLCNEFINYVTKLDSTLFIPSQCFVFETPTAGTRGTRYDTDRACLKGWSSKAAEYVVKVVGNEMLCDVLQVLRTIVQHQQVVVSNLNMDCINTCSDNTRTLLDLLRDKRNNDRAERITDKSGKTKLLFDIIKRKVYEDGDPGNESTTDILRSALEEKGGSTEDTTSALMLEILKNSTEVHGINAISRRILDSIVISTGISSLSMTKCQLQSCVFLYVMQQLVNCTKLTKLDLSGTFGLREDTRDIIASITSLKELSLYNCCMARTVSHTLMVGVLNCNNLEILNLGENTLTDSIAYLMSQTTGFPELKTLLLSDAELSNDDILSISVAVKNDKLPHLQNLHLTWNDLTNCLKRFFFTEQHPGFRSLEEFRVDNTRISELDIWAISDAILQDKLPNMKELAYSPDILNQLLTSFLSHGGLEHPGYQFVERLTLRGTKFSLPCLSSALRMGQFPRVRDMDFSFSSLRNSLGALFGDPTCTFPVLESLNLTSSELSATDLNHFQSAVSRYTFENLKRLFMSHNTLRNGIGKMFTDPGFPKLEVLELCNTQLSNADVIGLSKALHSGKLPCLKVLNLAENVLTGTLSFLLDDSSSTSSFGSLESFSCGYSELCKTDMESLSGAIMSGRLPQLGYLDLEGNSLLSKPDETENLILFSVSRYKDKGLKISLKANDFSTQFSLDLDALCRQTKVTLRL